MLIYALSGETSKEVVDERRDVHCFNASLSEQDFERVGEASARAYALSTEMIHKVHQQQPLTWFSSHKA